MARSFFVKLKEGARLKAEADERDAAEEAGSVTRKAQNSAAKAKAAAAANEVARPHAAKDKEKELQAAKIKEETARHAREAQTAKCKEQAASADRRKAK